MGIRIRAEVTQQAVISMSFDFAVRVIEPVEIPWKVYKIPMAKLLIKATSKEHEKRVLYEELMNQVLIDYNRQIEDSPILDMFEDPSKFETASWVDFDFLNVPEMPRRITD